MNQQIALVGYGLAGTAFAVLALLTLTIWRERIRGSLLPVACAAGALWGWMLAYLSGQADVSGFQILLIEIVHDVVWLVFITSILGGAITATSNWVVRWGGVILGALILLAGIIVELSSPTSSSSALQGLLLILGSIATSLYALVGIEQIYRNARPSQQDGLNFLCLSLGGIFAYDLFVYSNAVVSGQVGTLLWGARGYVVAMCVPMIGVSVSRIASWHKGIFVSRQVVFYTTTLIGSGLYLTAIGFAGHYIKQIGKDWGPAFQIVFLSAAVLGFLVLLLSDQIRAKIRVVVAKHFFERKYDYRAEWLRLIETLTSAEDGLPLKKRAIKSLAQIVNSQSGHLWLVDETAKRYRPVSGWNVQPAEGEIGGTDDFIDFLSSSGWIIDLNELKIDPDRYQHLREDSLPSGITSNAFVIPLQHEARLLGFVTLSKPRTPFTLTYEDYDLLKTAGQQIASYLAQEIGTEQLAESRQFEAYNRFTAFVMHDLKNAIAQQTLVVKNAEKHKRNPEFVDDAMEAIKGSVTRMKRVMSHLQQRTLNQPMQNLDLSKLVLQAESRCSDRNPVPVASVPDEAVPVLANRDRLLMAVCNALRNAQDATKADGRITIDLTKNESDCDIRISDTGTGMDADFVRDRLFRPFDSTKGPVGMGIGAYQIRETVLSYGGDVSIDSAVEKGTTLTLSIPLASGGTG